MIKYLEDHFRVTAVKRDYNYPAGAGLAPDGYTKRSGAPTRYMIQIDGGKRWYRVMVIQFSNAGSTFIRVGGVRYFIRYDGTLTGE